MRSLLPTEQLAEMEDRIVVTDEDACGNRCVKFSVDETPTSPTGKTTAPPGGDNVCSRVPPAYSPVPPFPNLTMRRASPSLEIRERPSQDHFGQDRGISSGSPDFWWWSIF